MYLTGQIFIPGTWSLFPCKVSSMNVVIFYPAFLNVHSGKLSGYLAYCIVHPLKLKSFFNLRYDSKLQGRCCPVSDSVKYFPTGKLEIPPSSLSSEAAEDQIYIAEKDVRPKMKNINGFPLPSEKSTRQAPRGTNKTTDLPLKSDGKLRASSPAEDDAAYDILRGCSQCGILLPLPTLNQHQVPASVLSLLSCEPRKEIQDLQNVHRHPYLPFLCVSQ